MKLVRCEIVFDFAADESVASWPSVEAEIEFGGKTGVGSEEICPSAAVPGLDFSEVLSRDRSYYTLNILRKALGDAGVGNITRVFRGGMFDKNSNVWLVGQEIAKIVRKAQKASNQTDV